MLTSVSYECEKQVTVRVISDLNSIKDLLIMFDPIFPHLHEKIASYEEYAQKLAKFATVVVCESESETVGILVFYANDLQTRTAYISLIGVSEKWRGMRLGQRLLDYCVFVCENSGMEYLMLEVDADNVVAQEFYKKNGFSCCGKSDRASIYLQKRINGGNTNGN